MYDMSPATCRRRFHGWEVDGVWEEVWHEDLRHLDDRGLLRWQERFIGPTSMRAKKGLATGTTRKGKDTKRLVAEGGTRVPIAVPAASANPHKSTLAEPTFRDVRVPRAGRYRPRSNLFGWSRMGRTTATRSGND